MEPDTPQFLAARGIRVTGGANSGYVEDAVCAGCHQDLAASFTAVGMSRSFYRPRRASSIESFGVPFEHALSKRTYEMLWRGDQLVFRRWQSGPRGERVNEREQPVDWVLGSGNHARTYLFRTPSGELWQLPIAWYTREGKWGMAPGYDRPDHEELQRAVQRECMVCHDAYPELPAGADAYGMPHRFPAALPEGVGCQRCHGPGAEHVRRVRDPVVPVAAAKAAIVNPARLTPARRAEVCYQCHLQPIVALPAVRRFERGDLAFRPGESLAAHRVELDADEEGRGRDERFEINHHPYRLEQSRCFRESPVGALSCLTCHDPHRKVAVSERAAHYRAACLSCHRAEQLPPREGHGTSGAAATADCTSCHMPERRTEDVVHVVMTDHRIQRPPAGIDLLAPRAEHDPVLVGASFLRPEEAPPGNLGELYRAVGVLRIGGRTAMPRVAALLAAEPPLLAEPWLRLAVEQLQTRTYADAESALRRAMTLPGGDTPLAHVWLGLSLAGQRRLDDSLAELALAAARDPDLVEAHFNRGRLLLANGRAAEALPALERAVALRPTFAAGWLRLGDAKEARARESGAGVAAARLATIADYRRALAVEPSTTDAYVALARALRESGDDAAAREAVALGKLYARRPEAVAAAEAGSSATSGN
ncbi:MAG TPA: tetratricopeptide repeat protein [Thermoanaerobaculia bacterium]|nr:tetratricopeptide repeat protein [Thermoanaerobaculia bacterium]